MKKELIEATAAKLMVALKEFYAVTGAFTIIGILDGEEHEALMQLKIFKEAFGDRGFLVDREYEGEFPYQKELVLEGVKFLCLLTEEEAKEVRDEQGS